MIIFQTAAGVRRYCQMHPPEKPLTGFVPTMGALHDGHLALVDVARQHCERVIVSIFVNPTQFNEASDLAKYPVTLSSDIARLEASGCDILYLPSTADVYPEGIGGLEKYDLHPLDSVWEGAYRPGHFQGVCQVMHRLLKVASPHRLYMGQKDWQQCKVIARLLDATGLPVQLVICPTQRHADGLAMSSRNLRLTEEQRVKAPALYKQLQWMANHLHTLSPAELIEKATSQLFKSGFDRVDYLAIVDPHHLQAIYSELPVRPLILLAAAWLGDVRLIDNLPVGFEATDL